MTSPWAPASTSAFEYFAALVAEDEHFPLLEAAAAVGLDDDPVLDVEAVLAEVDALAERLRLRLPQVRLEPELQVPRGMQRLRKPYNAKRLSNNKLVAL
jgi:hypothetical protein